MAEKKILIVDYDAGSLEKMVKLLNAHKFRTVTAADGQAGYEAFLAGQPDLVVIEAMLPKMHGFDLTQKISRETAGKIPVILVTGLYKGPQYRQEALNALGASEYFEKPLDSAAFVSAVRRLLHDDDDFGVDLPEPSAVIEALSRRSGHASPRGEGTPDGKGQRP